MQIEAAGVNVMVRVRVSVGLGLDTYIDKYRHIHV